MTQLIGQSLGRYHITGMLGQGGMGAVYKALDTALKREVALKVMHAQYSQQSDFIQRFLREAQAAARLDHAGIIRVYDFGQTETQLYIVMEFIAGPNLQQYLDMLHERKQWLALPAALRLGRQIAQALAYAHAQGVLHRDLKSANIMLKPRAVDEDKHLPFTAVITDLGLAKLQDSSLTTLAGGQVGGTPAYMSPEQAKGQPVDQRSDIYSLGVILFELIVGQRPFPIKGYTDALRYHSSESPPTLQSIHPNLPPRVAQLILRALAKNPAQRFASASVLVRALEAVLATNLPTAVPPKATQGPADLSAMLQQSLRSASSPQTPRKRSKPPAIPTDPTQDRLLVLQPSGSSYRVALTGNQLTIGRGPHNDISLEDIDLTADTPAAMRLLVEFDGAHYYVSNQGDEVPAHLGADLLLPGLRIRWMPEKTLRVGQHQVVLQRGQRVTIAPLSLATTEAYGVQTARPPRERRKIPRRETLWIGAYVVIFLASGLFIWRFGGVFVNLLNEKAETIPTPAPAGLSTSLLVEATITNRQAEQTATSEPILTPHALPVLTVTTTPVPPTELVDQAATDARSAEIAVRQLQQTQTAVALTAQIMAVAATQTRVGAALATQTQQARQTAQAVTLLAQQIALDATKTSVAAVEATSTQQAMAAPFATRQATLGPVQTRQAEVAALAQSSQKAPAPIIDLIEMPLTFSPSQPFDIEVRASNAGLTAQGGGSLTLSLPDGGDIAVTNADVRILPASWQDCTYSQPNVWVRAPKSACKKILHYGSLCPPRTQTLTQPVIELWYKPWSAGTQHSFSVRVTPPTGAKSIRVLVRVALRYRTNSCGLSIEPPQVMIANATDQQGFPAYAFTVSAAE